MFKLRQSSLTARNIVLKDLYAVLSPEQRTLAGQQLVGDGCGFDPCYGMGYGGRVHRVRAQAGTRVSARCAAEQTGRYAQAQHER